MTNQSSVEKPVATGAIHRQTLRALDAVSLPACIFSQERGIEQVNELFSQRLGITEQSRRDGLRWEQLLDSKDKARTIRSFLAHRDCASEESIEIPVSLAHGGAETQISIALTPLDTSSDDLQYLAILRGTDAVASMPGRAVGDRTLEKLIINLSCRVVRADPQDTDKVVTAALGEVCQFIGADRAYQFNYDWEQMVSNNTHEWCAEGIEPQIEFLQGIPMTELDLWLAMHRKGLPFMRSDVMSLSESDPLRQILEPQGVQSLLTLPVKLGGKCIGFIGFDSVREKREYSEIEVSLLELLADLFANIEHKRSREQQILDALEDARHARQIATEQARLASEASSAKSQFLATMSHEFRTPLHVILGMTSRLEESNDPQVVELCLTTLKEAGQNLLGIVGDVLDFTRIEKNLINLEYVKTSPGTIINKSRLLMQPIADRRKIDLTFRTNEPDLWLSIDEQKCTQILNNLCSNALKFASTAVTVDLEVRHTGLDAEKHYLFISLEDDGPGIPESELPKIQAPFYQVGTSQSDLTSAGTGLGLAIVRGLLDVTGGTMQVASTVGVGSRFSVEIPTVILGEAAAPSAAAFAKLQPHPESKEAQAEAAPYDAAASQSAGVRILLAEDNKMNQMLIKMYLDDTPYHLDIADDGDQAVEKALMHDYQLILMDCRMPGLDGFEATRKIRAQLRQAARAQPVILAVTASSIEGDHLLCLEAGMNDLIAKPFPQEALLASIERHLHAAQCSAA